ncbi:MAG: NAD-binding protein [Phycisphaerae bacterium]|nr:NAD-binding protein [Phycisphaerae bacterium]
MPDSRAERPSPETIEGTYRLGHVELTGPVRWVEGTRVTVKVASVADAATSPSELGPVIIAGFGLAGRWVADIFDRHKVPYVIVERNTETVETQARLARAVIEGDISDEETLRRAGIESASILALTIPDEQAVLKATQLARRLKPDIYIVARTTYSSVGLEATRLGADEVIKAEQAVASQFHEMLLRKLGVERAVDTTPSGPARTPPC